MKEPEHVPAQHEISTTRLETLTDGIFAIAMTLLVFGLSISDPDRTPLLMKLGHLLPNVLSVIVSFVILGVVWVATHSQFQYIRRADHALIWLNLSFLLCVTLVPFSAGVLGRYAPQPIAVILYGSNLVVCLLFHYGMWRHATRGGHLVDANLDPRIVRMGTRLAWFAIISYAVAISLAFVPEVSVILYTLIPVPYILGVLYRYLGR
jgi:TMEM175 potassium channel family protein